MMASSCDVGIIGMIGQGIQLWPCLGSMWMCSRGWVLLFMSCMCPIMLNRCILRHPDCGPINTYLCAVRSTLLYFYSWVHITWWRLRPSVCLILSACPNYHYSLCRQQSRHRIVFVGIYFWRMVFWNQYLYIIHRTACILVEVNYQSFVGLVWYQPTFDVDVVSGGNTDLFAW